MTAGIEIKVCGVTDSSAANAILRAGADRIGLVLYRRSSRFVSLEQAEKIAASIESGRPLTLVTVDESPEALAEIYRRLAGRVGRIQLHGSESAEQIARLKERLAAVEAPMPEIVRRISDERERGLFLPHVDKLLWEERGVLPGGNGVRGTLPKRAFFSPGERFAVAGGLTPENVAEVLAAAGVGEVDVSSGVEISPGVKSIEKVCRFIAAVAEYAERSQDRVPAAGRL